jgi:hypothetical protein
VQERYTLYTAMGIISRLLALDDALGRLGDNIARWVLFSVYLYVLTSEPTQFFFYCRVQYLKNVKSDIFVRPIFANRLMFSSYRFYLIAKSSPASLPLLLKL